MKAPALPGSMITCAPTSEIRLRLHRKLSVGSIRSSLMMVTLIMCSVVELKLSNLVTLI